MSHRMAPSTPNSRSAPDYEEDDEEDDDAEYEDEEMEEDHQPPTKLPPAQPLRPAQSFGVSILASSPPRGLKRSRNGEARAQTAYANESKRKYMENKNRVRLEESDEVILQSERIISDMFARIDSQPSQSGPIFTDTAAQLTKLWRASSDIATKSASVGPKSSKPFTNANYLASLLLQLHYPHTYSPRQAGSRPSRAIVPASEPQQTIPLPHALLNWLNTYHNPFGDDFDEIHLHQPSPSDHESFWDVLYAALLRGKLDRVVRLLKDAGWENAYTAEDDGASNGYTDQELDNVDEVVTQCIQVLEACPGYCDQDWDTKSFEWTTFRQRVRHTLEELESFCEGDDLGQSLGESNIFQRSMGNSLNMSTASRKASSRVPWSIYQNLKLLYGMMLGEPDDIIMTAQDWLEGSIYLTVWWDTADEERSANTARSRASRQREVDVAPLQTYRKRLADAFARVQEQPAEIDEQGREMKNVFIPDFTDHTQLGLACILEENIGGAIFALRRFSILISVSVVEIAASDRWLPTTRGGFADQGFDREDLLLLSQAPTQLSPTDQDRDEILEQYAELLFEKPSIGDKEGWELAVNILSRLDQQREASTRIADLLEKLELSTEETVDKVLNVCDQLGQSDQRKAIAERYADKLAENDNQVFGPALIYYARAHAEEKLKATVSHITSLCLLHSIAMPDHRLIDAKLSQLITKDRPALKQLGHVDLEAATLLSKHLSGYATLRRFYELRDQGFVTEATTRAAGPLERKRQAAASIFAVIKSASDCIPGGLFDQEAETVVPVDGLLALFGETLPLLGQSQRIFTQHQVFSLLGVLEDFIAAPRRIRENAESLLSASLNAYREETSTASGPFKKQKSNFSESSSWEMLASNSMIASREALKKGEKMQRAWDWRQGLVQSGIEASEMSVVKLVREALVKEVASGWGGKLNW
ncbi:uncharacterized protein MYCFIDRAFT_215074 [Pseudocercospora fijiensis CIRAD86]|uniref:Nuclear pore complex protein Nup85 n=1 Tax=Pseudocercospora fijiensis (strain CIRAD86) TaxID=383855 RepID=M2YYP4_PSEFD|nr:uncharacterized protein MYCFIDRAFT_215074 [Pseudocercospora fijiensis CIRAD86]EME82745.1 hypothetical protein MYCFIDRAFT_215074 [Pseudocercospora fijiensis CIRAD86]